MQKISISTCNFKHNRLKYLAFVFEQSCESPVLHNIKQLGPTLKTKPSLQPHNIILLSFCFYSAKWKFSCSTTTVANQ